MLMVNPFFPKILFFDQFSRHIETSELINWLVSIVMGTLVVKG